MEQSIAILATAQEVQMTTATTLVLGATGKTGRRVVERLSARGLTVRLGSRSGMPPFDWTAPETWPAALQGVDAVYVSYFPDFIAPGAFDAIRDFTTLAVSSGVSRLVLLSGRGAPEAESCEELVRQSGVASTIVRASWFSQNFSESFLLDAILAGEVALPVGDNVGEPFVDADDLADIAVEALTDERHEGQLYDVTGPRLLTFSQAVAEIARATGRDIRYSHVSRDAYEAALATQAPVEFVKLFVHLLTEVLDGRNAHVTDGVERALGRPPREFSAFVRDVVAAGTWTSAQELAAPESYGNATD